MFTFFKIIYFIAIILIALVIVGELIVSKLGEGNKFRKWWRKTVIAEYND